MLELIQNNEMMKQWLDKDDPKFTLFQILEMDYGVDPLFIYEVYYRDGEQTQLSTTSNSDEINESELYQRIYLPLKEAILSKN